MSEKDERDCPKCGARMEMKAPLPNDCWLWQCPACKNVEFLAEP